ncbi:MAG: hypothetical protein LBJ00_03135 [Planctomycetaceae bacterium]|jgi:hypothetical protein|nr:hypothetical protein [Planctomycetaceae bacterium]
MKTILNLISFGENYLMAIFFYLGVGLLSIGFTPDSPIIRAQGGCGGEVICPAGQECCGGVCCSGNCVSGECICSG